MTTEVDIHILNKIRESIPLIIDLLIKEFPFNTKYYKEKEWVSNIKSQAFETCKFSILSNQTSPASDQCIRDNINRYYKLIENKQHETYTTQ